MMVVHNCKCLQMKNKSRSKQTVTRMCFDTVLYASANKNNLTRDWEKESTLLEWKLKYLRKRNEPL